MDFYLTQRLLLQGHLPNFLRLMKNGSFHMLESSIPPYSYVAWAAIAAGANPGSTGIFDVISRDAKTYKIYSDIEKSKFTVPYKPKPFWAITSEHNVPTTVIRWPGIYPPEKVSGKMLCGLGVPDMRGFHAGYTFYSEESEEFPSKAPNRVICVVRKGNQINTDIIGPSEIDNGAIIDIKARMVIAINSKISISVDGKDYLVHQEEWSDFIKVSFSVDASIVTGIFKAYVIDTDPFKMYITAIHIDPESPSMPISYPDKYSIELAKKIGFFHTMGFPEEADGFTDNRLSEKSFLEQIYQIENERKKIFFKEFHEFENNETGLLAFVFDSSDRLQHIFWEKGENNNKIAEYYMKKDDFLGRLLDKIDANTLLLIVSDHGFTFAEKRVSLNTWLRDSGYLATNGNSIKDIDWSRTKAYSVGLFGIYINLEGREKRGIVKDNDKDKLIDEIISGLKTLRDPENNGKPVYEVYRKEEIYSGRNTILAPDMVVGFSNGYQHAPESAMGGAGGPLFDKGITWRGTHLTDRVFVPGVLFSNIKFKNNVCQNDIAPTILDSFGIPVPESMEGKSLLK
ncbi:MAG: alkaline phosphatase family protein [Nanoarchaeota archaeon]|nr:alkaline phosphatase family protein [Nanoarchaeota archaeon]